VTGSRWWQDLDTAVAAALPAGARVLDVGCGDGGLVDRLAELGFDALGVDPAAPARPRLIRAPIEHVRDLGAFDAVNCRHGAPPRATGHRHPPSSLLRPHGRLFVYDFDWQAYDDRAATWLARHDSPDADNSVTGWQREHGDLRTGAEIKAALTAHFEPLLETRRPYLARMLKRRDLETAERTH
jgi:SAM-dependent methyltransferase